MAEKVGFSGVEVAVLLEHGVHVCGVRGADEKYVLFQRGESEGAGSIHFEYSSQLHGGYDLVRECRLSRRCLSIDLSQPFRSMPGAATIEVSLEIEDAAFDTFRKGLEAVFAPCPERFRGA